MPPKSAKALPQTASGAAVPASIDDTLALLTGASYVGDRSLATVLFLALRMGRPLFLEGEAGVGKTEIAKVLASALGRRLIRLQCYEGLDISSAVYEWNYAAQMMAIRLAEAAGETDRTRLEHDIFSERYLIRRPLLQALEPQPEGPPVLLIDELDRTDEAFEAFLLEALSDFQITVPELGAVKADEAAHRHHHLQPHARDPRRAEAALPVSLGRLSRRRARDADRARQGARCAGAPDGGDRRLRAGPARAGPVQEARRRRNARLGDRAA